MRLTDELKRLREDIVVLMTTAVENRFRGGAAVQRQPDRLRRAALLHSQDLAGNVGGLRHLFDLFEQRTQLLHCSTRPTRPTALPDFHWRRIAGGAARRVLAGDGTVSGQRQVIGTLGVIGPTRMAHDRVIPIVDLTAKLLSSAMQREMGAAG